jgi:ATP dependent DNA ligase-like protein
MDRLPPRNRYSTNRAGGSSPAISRFEWLRGRPKDEAATSPVYIAFDILEVNGRDLRAKPLKERRRVLERLSNHHSMIFAARRLSNGFKAWGKLCRVAMRVSWPRTLSHPTSQGGP